MNAFALKMAFTFLKLTMMGAQTSKPVTMFAEPEEQPSPVRPSTMPEVMPTTGETVEELRKRLAKELYRMELDLANGGRIAGKPCDCLSAKHHFGIEATAEELMAYERNPVYNNIITWLNRNAVDFEPAQISRHPEEYYHRLIPEVRNFRKQVMGTENVGAMAASR